MINLLPMNDTKAKKMLQTSMRVTANPLVNVHLGMSNYNLEAISESIWKMVSFTSNFKQY